MSSNFVRETMLAERANSPREEVLALQEAALRQYLVEYRNLPGFLRLLREYGYAGARDLVDELLDELEGDGKVVYSSAFSKYLSLREWLEAVRGCLKRGKR